MKKITAFMLILILSVLSLSAAETAVNVTEYPMGKEIGLANQAFDKNTGNQVLYQAFALTPEMYHYFYVGFMQDKPSSNPNVIPASLASYTLVDVRTINPDAAAEDNMTFITNPTHPIWLWYRIKSTYAVSIQLSLSKIYFEGDATSPHFFYPYLALYEPDGVTEMKIDKVFYSGRGGWRSKGKDNVDKNPDNIPGTGDAQYTPTADPDGKYDLYHVTGDSIVITVLDEKEVKNISRGNYLLMKMEAHYGGKDIKKIGIGQYKAPIVLTVTVK